MLWLVYLHKGIKTQRNNMWLIVLMYAIFASSFPITKILRMYTTPIFLTGVRMLIGGGILLTYYAFYRKKNCTIYKHQYWTYAQIIFIGIYLNYIARFWAIEYLTSVKACFLFNISPLLSSFFSYIFFGETISKKQWLGFFFGFSALAPIILTSSPSEAFMGEFAFVSWPELAMLFSVAADSYKWILMRKLVKEQTCSPVLANGLCMGLGGLFALITAFFIEGAFPVNHMVPFTGYILLYILISNIISYNLYGFLLRSYTATFLSLAGFMAPLFAAFYGWALLNEHISWHFYLSIVMLAIGLYLFYQDELRKNNALKTGIAD